MTPSSGLQVVSGAQNDPVSLFFLSSQTKASIRDNVHPNHCAMTFNFTITKIWQKIIVPQRPLLEKSSEPPKSHILQSSPVQWKVGRQDSRVSFLARVWSGF